MFLCFFNGKSKLFKTGNMLIIPRVGGKIYWRKLGQNLLRGGQGGGGEREGKENVFCTDLKNKYIFSNAKKTNNIDIRQTSLERVFYNPVLAHKSMLGT